jgi:diketogulonate reductase-like aldo/keto reductase
MDIKMTLANIPPFLYGTAWKEAATQALVTQALNLGFTGIDTANQRVHYFEEAVGLGIQDYLKSSGKSRADLFIQTKFTSANGQDQRKPYNEFDPLTEQVKQSFASSLQHLQTDYLDSYVLHGPSYYQGIHAEDLEIWAAMEALQRTGKIHFLGISNVNVQQLKELFNKAAIKPKFVQNRCFANTRWDAEVRKFCHDNNMIYQGFSLLTANMNYLLTPQIQALAQKYHKTIPQITFRFARQLGMVPLTGTSNSEHMRKDLDVEDFELLEGEMNGIEDIGITLSL